MTLWYFSKHYMHTAKSLFASSVIVFLETRNISFKSDFPIIFCYSTYIQGYMKIEDIIIIDL